MFLDSVHKVAVSKFEQPIISKIKAGLNYLS